MKLFRIHPRDRTLIAFLDSELSLARHGRILAHIQSCPPCSAKLATFDQVFRSCEAARPVAPPGLLARTRIEIDAASAHSAWRCAAREEVAALVGTRQAAAWASQAALQDPSAAFHSVSPILSSFLGRRTLNRQFPPVNPGNAR